MKLPTLRRVVATAGAGAALFSLVAVPTFAQTQQAGNGFRISPVRSEFTIQPGQSEVLSLTLENPSDGSTTARAIINDFVASDKEDGEPRLILDENAEAPKNSFRSLVQPIEDVELGPREKKDIPVTIAVPDDANAGGYYGAIRFAPVLEDNQDGNVGLTASVGSIVLVRVPGDLKEQLNLLDLSAAQNSEMKSFFTGGDISVITRLENAGDIHVKPFGKVIVKNMFGNTVEEFELNSGETEDARANILPGSIRRFENELSNKKWFGRYTIEASLGYSQGSGELLIAQASFWYLPVWSLIVLALLVVGLIGLGYYLYLRFSGKPRHGKKRK